MELHLQLLPGSRLTVVGRVNKFHKSHYEYSAETVGGGLQSYPYPLWSQFY